jgi:hypothetical protein
MRQKVQKDSIFLFFQELSKRSKGPGRIYVTGGVSAVLLGWRETTVDLDIKLLPEPAGIFEAIRDVKEAFHVNIELASPDDFIPALPSWETRSRFIVRFGDVDFFHYDFYGQALAKIERGHVRDIADVTSMFQNGLIEKNELRRLFEAVEPSLVRYPSINPSSFLKKLEAILGQIS